MEREGGQKGSLSFPKESVCKSKKGNIFANNKKK